MNGIGWALSETTPLEAFVVGLDNPEEAKALFEVSKTMSRMSKAPSQDG